MNRKIWNIFVWALGFFALVMLTYRIHQSFSKKDIQDSLCIVYKSNHLYFLFIVIILMPVNWLIESWKWYKVSNLVEKKSFKTAVLSLLVGLAYGHLLPGRTSEFLGKILFFSKKNRSNISVLHFINASFQMYITVFSSLLFLLIYFDNSMNTNTQITIFLSVFIFILISILIVYADKLYFLKKFLPSLNYQMPHALKLELIIWSVIRYIIFIIQFYSIFLVFNHQQVLDLKFIAQVSLYFLFTSVIPMISIIEIATRALIAIFIFQNSGINDIQLTLITSIMWLINLVIPSIAGFAIWAYLFQQNRK